MRQHRHTDGSFIKEVNKILEDCQHRPYALRAVKPWRDGVCIPRPPVVAAIAELTGGLVTYQDHVDQVKEHGIRTRPIPPAPTGTAI